MALEVAHTTTVTGADDPTKEINKDQWNGTTAHTLFGEVVSAQIADGAVTLAKMADLAQDTFIIRTTAGTGVPETAACTAAGRALLDDAAASNQRTTLGLGTIATQNANAVAITGGSVTGTTGVYYAIQLFSPLHNPVDAQTVYFGSGAPGSTTADIFDTPVPIDGTIIAIYLECGVGGTLGSGESSTASIRHNNTTDVQISAAVTLSAARQQFSATGLAQAVSAGDRMQLKLAHATFATNPTNVIYCAIVVIRP